MITIKKQFHPVSALVTILAMGVLMYIVFVFCENSFTNTLVRVFFFAAKYLMLLTVIPAISIYLTLQKERYFQIHNGYKRLIIFQSRYLAKSWKGNNSFGKYQLDSLLNVVHLALEANIKKEFIIEWMQTGFAQTASGLLSHDLKFVYPEIGLSYQLAMLFDDEFPVKH